MCPTVTIVIIRSVFRESIKESEFSVLVTNALSNMIRH